MIIGHWIIFSLLIVLIPVGIASFALYFSKKSFLSKKEIKRAYPKLFNYILFYWLCDLFYMACFNDWLIWKFVFGCLILIAVLYSVTTSFIIPKEKNNFEKVGLLQDFLVGVGLGIYLIYIIPIQEVKDIVIPMASAIFGGLLTLVGVAWTIRYTAKDKKEDAVKLNKPLLFIVNPKNVTSPDNVVNTNLDFCPLEDGNESKKTMKASFKPFFLKNGDFSYSVLRGIQIDDYYSWIEIGQVFEKNTIYKITFNANFIINKNPKRVYLILEDMLNNLYKIDLNFSVNDEDDSLRKIIINSGISITKLDDKLPIQGKEN